jgi:hypothetical protein
MLSYLREMGKCLCGYNSDFFKEMRDGIFRYLSERFKERVKRI